MSTASATSALAAYLRSVDAINTLVAGRIYRPQLDPDEDVSMAIAAIVIRHAGGYQMSGAWNVPIGDPRLNLYCYGSTWLEAERVAEAVPPVLRVLRNFAYEGTRLYWARIEMGPTPYEDPETNWPCLVVSAQVALCEVAAT